MLTITMSCFHFPRRWRRDSWKSSWKKFKNSKKMLKTKKTETKVPKAVPEGKTLSPRKQSYWKRPNAAKALLAFLLLHGRISLVDLVLPEQHFLCHANVKIYKLHIYVSSYVVVSLFLFFSFLRNNPSCF